MKITPDDPRLTAYLLGELSPEESATIERAAAADPALRLAISDLDMLTGYLEDTLKGSGGHALRPMQREAIRRAVCKESEGNVVEGSFKSNKQKSLLWPGLAVAAAVAIASVWIVRLTSHESDGGGGMSITREMAFLPLPGPSVPGAEGDLVTPGSLSAMQQDMIGSAPREFMNKVAEEVEDSALPGIDLLPVPKNQSKFHDSSIRLPVMIGTTSATWVRRWIKEKKELPPRNAVRVEELINTATIPTDHEYSGLKVGVQTLAWQEKQWVAIQLAARTDQNDLSIKLSNAAPCRIVGSFVNRDDKALPRIIPNGRTTLIMLEYIGETDQLGLMEINQGVHTTHVDLKQICSTAGADMQHAMALAQFALWLRDETSVEALNESLEIAKQATNDPVQQNMQSLISDAIAIGK